MNDQRQDVHLELKHADNESMNTSALRLRPPANNKILTIVATGAMAIAAVTAVVVGTHHGSNAAPDRPAAQASVTSAGGASVDAVIALAPRDLPVPVDGLAIASVGSASDATVSDGSKPSSATPTSFSFSYLGTDLTKMVNDLRVTYVGAGFTISGDYNGKSKNVPTAGFVAKSDAWTIVVGGTVQQTRAAVSVTATRS